MVIAVSGGRCEERGTTGEQQSNKGKVINDGGGVQVTTLCGHKRIPKNKLSLTEFSPGVTFE